jgi:hypothetical protein
VPSELVGASTAQFTMCDEPHHKRAKLSDDNAAAETTCCSTLEEAMRLAHPGCLQSHLPLDTPADTFDGYVVWLHAGTGSSSVSCTDCLKVLPQVWHRSGHPARRRDIEALIGAGCIACVKVLFSNLVSSDQRYLLKQAARTFGKGNMKMVAEIYEMAVESSEKLKPHDCLASLFMKAVFNEAAYTHLLPARNQQSATAVPEFDKQFDFMADLITMLVTASAELTAVLAAALAAMLEVSCTDGIRWLRQQYCTTENTTEVIDSALQQLSTHDRCYSLDVAPLSAASLEALLEAGGAGRALSVYSVWVRTERTISKWLAQRGPIENHAQLCDSLRVIMAAAGAGAEALLVGASGHNLLASAVHSYDAQKLAVLLSNTALTQAVLTAKCSGAASALHHAVELSYEDDDSCSPVLLVGGLRACIEVIVKAVHDANCLHDVLSVQDAAGITAATWLLRIGYSDFVALLAPDSSLTVSLNHEPYYCVHTLCIL